jgi:hypothetical protein
MSKGSWRDRAAAGEHRRRDTRGHRQRDHRDHRLRLAAEARRWQAPGAPQKLRFADRGEDPGRRTRRETVTDAER